MKQYPLFAARFAVAPILSGTMVVSVGRGSSLFEWAHAAVGIATIYVVLVLVLRSVMQPRLRWPAAVSLLLALLETVPSVPLLHAALALLLFTTLCWGYYATLAPEGSPVPPQRSRWLFLLPAMLLVPIGYGIAYRHQVGEMTEHVGTGMLGGGVLLIVAFVLQQNAANRPNLMAAARIALWTSLFQIVFGMATLVLRILEIDGGLPLAALRAAHITGAAFLLAATLLLALQLRTAE
jgi:hypothetical protein